MTSVEKLLNGGGLVYIDCNGPGYRRKRRGNRFVYLNRRKAPIRNARTTARIESLVIPPQWSKVWICPDPKGHIQVTGIDQKSRKQYIYHPKWLALRGQDKFKQLASFGQGLPQLRKSIKKDMKLPELCLPKISAIALHIMDLTAIRPGNSQYTKLHGSFGLTTLRKKHLNIRGDLIALSFVGKKGVQQNKVIKSKPLARILNDLQEIPGKRLFQFFDAFGEKCNLESINLNNYLREHYEQEVTCKTFRTWSACHSFLTSLCSLEPAITVAAKKQILQTALGEVAKLLGNSKLISRKHYISPVLIDCYENGSLDRWLKKTGALSPQMREQAISKKLINIFRKNI